VFRHVALKVLYKQKNPYLHDLYNIAELQTVNLEELVSYNLAISKNTYSAFGSEFLKISQKLNKRYSKVALNYPVKSGMTNAGLKFLYFAVRMLKPKIIVESGVANGVSTFFITEALMRNRKGTLVSIDISNDVGSLVTDEQRKHWNLVILSRPTARTLKKILDGLPGIDIFLHDSSHFYDWQKLEYDEAWKRIRKGGLLISDDIDYTYAFYQFAKEQRRKPSILVTERRLMGIFKK
jgi:predicted O-methyltransferase YrrM